MQWGRELLDKLIITQLAKDAPTFLDSKIHCCSYKRTSLHPILSQLSLLSPFRPLLKPVISSSHMWLGPSSDHLPSGFAITVFFYPVSSKTALCVINFTLGCSVYIQSGKFTCWPLGVICDILSLANTVFFLQIQIQYSWKSGVQCYDYH